jgi:hypothetical protein
VTRRGTSSRRAWTRSCRCGRTRRSGRRSARLQPYAEQWNKGKYADVAGRAGFDILSLLTGAGEANAAGKLGTAARLGEAADVAKMAEVAQTAGKAADVAQAARAAEVAQAGKAAEVAQAGKAAGPLAEGGAAAARRPVIVDNDVLVRASRGDANALAALRAHDPHVTFSQIREFFEVESEVQQTRRAQFLLDEGVNPLSPGVAHLTTPELSKTFWDVAHRAGTGDAAMVIHALQKQWPILTGESRLTNTVQKTLQILGVDFIRVLWENAKNRTGAYDWSFRDAQAGDFRDLAKYGDRLLVAYRRNDPRLGGWREYLRRVSIAVTVSGVATRRSRGRLRRLRSYAARPLREGFRWCSGSHERRRSSGPQLVGKNAPVDRGAFLVPGIRRR